MNRGRQIGALVGLALLVSVLVPSSPVWACDCDRPPVDWFVEREPDAAVAWIRRIDTDGGSSGVGLVENQLHGPALPEQIPLALDDGGSCLPWLAVGEVAVLGLVHDGGGWRTLECGMLDPASALDDVATDPSARGPTAAVVSGRLPGAGLVALDDHLRVRATADVDGVGHGAHPCGEHLLVSRRGPDDALDAMLVGLDDLDVLDERTLSTEPDVLVELMDVACDDGRVDVVTMRWDEDPSAGPDVVVHTDLFGDDDVVELGAVEDAAFAGTGVAVLGGTDGGTDDVTLQHLDLATGERRTLLDLDGVMGPQVRGTKEGDHVLISGWKDEPLLIVVALDTGEEVARELGSWQPVAQPWLADDRILQIDEEHTAVGGDGLTHYRVVDLDLEVVTTLPPGPARSIATGAGTMLLAGGDGIRVIDAAGGLVRTSTQEWAISITGGLVLGHIAQDEESEDGVDPVDPVDLPPADPDLALPRPVEIDPEGETAASTPAGARGPVLIAVVIAIVAVGCVGLALALRRRGGHA